MTASSYTTSSYSSYRAYNGRLHDTRGDAWCTAVQNSNNDWLQVDFAKTVQVCAVATQGDVNGNEWVTDFKLSYSSDGNNWTLYKDTNGVEQVKCVDILLVKCNSISLNISLGGVRPALKRPRVHIVSMASLELTA